MIRRNLQPQLQFFIRATRINVAWRASRDQPSEEA
jgi:hypothetical protein